MMASPPQQSLSVDEALELAVGHHGAGDLQKAEDLYWRILDAEPEQPVALHLLGVIAHQMGDNAAAAELIGKAVAARPDYADAHGNLGLALQELGRFDEAITSYGKAIAINPGHHGAYMKLLLQCLAVGKKNPCPDGVRDALLSSPPEKLDRLQIEVSTWCNLKCAGCYRTIEDEAGAWTDTHMPTERFRSIIDNMPPSDMICLQGIGEATLHPDFRELVGIARDSGKYGIITLNTNALARSIGYYEELKEDGVFISVSVDSLDQEIADACRAGTKVGKLKERIKALRKTMGAHMMISIVVSRNNLKDICQTLEFLDILERPSGLPPLNVEFQELIIHNEETANDDGRAFGLDDTDVETFKADIAGYDGRFTNLRLSSSRFLHRGDNGTRCPRPFTRPYVTVDGYLTPCCVIEDADLFDKTDMTENSLENVWRKPVIGNWLSSYLDRYPDICDGCCFK